MGAPDLPIGAPPHAPVECAVLNIAARASAAVRSPPGTECAYTFNVVETRAWLSRCETATIGTPAASISVAMK